LNLVILGQAQSVDVQVEARGMLQEQHGSVVARQTLHVSGVILDALHVDDLERKWLLLLELVAQLPLSEFHGYLVR